MSRSNTANGGSSYVDLVIQVVSTSNDAYVLRGVVYLTSLNVTDTSNDLSIGGSWGRSGTLNLDGVYSSTPVWFTDITVNRVVGSSVTATITMNWSGVNYWGVTLSASESYVVPEKATAPSQPAAPTMSAIAATSVHATASLPYNGGSAITNTAFSLFNAPSGGTELYSSGVIPGAVTSIDFAGLAKATTYYCAFLAINAYGWSPWSARTAFTTLSTVPDQAAAPTVSAITATSATVNFSSMPGNGGSAITDTGYALYTVPSGGTAIANDSAVGVVTSWNFTGLTRKTTYYVSVWAINANGWGAESPRQAFTTLAVPPTMGTGYVAGSITRDSAIISGLSVIDNGGEAPDNAAVEYNTSASSVGSSTIVRGSWSNIPITGLTADTDYYYRCGAHNSAGWSNPVPTWKTFRTLLDTPDSMAAPTFSSVGDNSMRVNWVAPNMNGATFSAYRYEISLTDTFASLVTSGTTTSLYVDLTGLIAGTKYYARVRANATPNNGGFGTASQFTTGIAPLSGMRCYAVIGGVVYLGDLYTFIGGVRYKIRPMTVISGTVQTE